MTKTKEHLEAFKILAIMEPEERAIKNGRDPQEPIWINNAQMKSLQRWNLERIYYAGIRHVVVEFTDSSCKTLPLVEWAGTVWIQQ
jgi:hypothetical protein